VNKDDADCVDLIHTDGSRKGHFTKLYLGTMQHWGDIDFYPNGGAAQPACKFAHMVMKACSHRQSIIYFVGALTKGEKTCKSKSCYDPANIATCSEVEGQDMGYFSSCYKEVEERCHQGEVLCGYEKVLVERAFDGNYRVLITHILLYDLIQSIRIPRLSSDSRSFVVQKKAAPGIKALHLFDQFE
jgi:hypothetical protein